MFCKNCGKEIIDGSVCDCCNNAYEGNEAVIKSKSNKLIFVSIIVIIVINVLAITALLFFVYNRNSTSKAEEQLNKDERRIYNALISVADNFYSPETVKVLECSKIYTDDDGQSNGLADETQEHCYIKINSQVRTGGKNTTVYCLVIDEKMIFSADDVREYNGYGSNIYSEIDDLIEAMYPDFEVLDVTDDINVGKINRAYTEYLEENGWT